MLTPLYTCKCCQEQNYLVQPFYLFFSDRLSSHLTHIHCGVWQIVWNKKSCHWPMLVVVFVAVPVRFLSFMWCQVPWGLSMLAFPISCSSASHDISSQSRKVGEERQRGGMVLVDSERSGSWGNGGNGDRALGFRFLRR